MTNSTITIKVPNPKFIAKRIQKETLTALLLVQYSRGNTAASFKTYNKIKSL